MASPIRLTELRFNRDMVYLMKPRTSRTSFRKRKDHSKRRGYCVVWYEDDGNKPYDTRTFLIPSGLRHVEFRSRRQVEPGIRLRGVSRVQQKEKNDG